MTIRHMYPFQTTWFMKGISDKEHCVTVINYSLSVCHGNNLGLPNNCSSIIMHIFLFVAKWNLTLEWLQESCVAKNPWLYWTSSSTDLQAQLHRWKQTSDLPAIMLFIRHVDLCYVLSNLYYCQSYFTFFVLWRKKNQSNHISHSDNPKLSWSCGFEVPSCKRV